MAKDNVFRLIDESMSILDYIEREVGEIAKSSSRDEPPSKGTVYSLYSLVVRLRDKISELRAEIYRDYTESKCSND